LRASSVSDPIEKLNVALIFLQNELAAFNLPPIRIWSLTKAFIYSSVHLTGVGLRVEVGFLSRPGLA
jgi:hypothetical protein